VSSGLPFPGSKPRDEVCPVFRRDYKNKDLYTMEFYSATKNDILSFAGKWMELENIILSDVRFRRPKVECFLSYVEYRPNANTALL
jgi:hypothetical protein